MYIDGESSEEEEGAEEDLSLPYQSDFSSKFTKRIANFHIPFKKKMPSIIRTYDGSGDPDDHLNTFARAEETKLWSVPVWCRIFAQMLVGPARVCFQALEPGSIDNYKKLEVLLGSFFTQQRKYIKGPTMCIK